MIIDNIMLSFKAFYEQICTPKFWNTKIKLTKHENKRYKNVAEKQFLRPHTS